MIKMFDNIEKKLYYINTCGAKSVLQAQNLSRRGGGIGRRVRLRGVWLTRVSSSLILDTKCRKSPK